VGAIAPMDFDEAHIVVTVDEKDYITIQEPLNTWTGRL